MKSEDLAKNFDSILDAIHEDLLIADGNGVVLKVSPTFESVYGLDKDYAIGKTVYHLEKEGYFTPSIVAKVLQEKKTITMRQKNNKGRDIIVTATPVFHSDHTLNFVVTFSRDITEILQLQKAYSELETKIETYTEEINHLRKNAAIASGIIGTSEEMTHILEVIKRVADFDANILFSGPSGVGKTMLAKILHQNSRRAQGPFIDINCAAIPENLLESELFGYEKGSFTGAGSGGKIGLIELAGAGTLLLDEISEMPLSLQAKLLKVIQDKTITKVGGTKNIPVDFRLIAATNRDLEHLTEAGRFRKDLFYRLNVISIEIPPLKERREDIIPLLTYFLQKNNEKYRWNKRFHPHAIEALVQYPWPGNVRELMNIIDRVSMTCEGPVIKKEALPREVREPKQRTTSYTAADTTALEKALEDLEKNLVQNAYAKHKTTVGVGKALHISQPTAYRKIRKYIVQEKKGDTDET